MSAAVRGFGKLNVLVNNAGILRMEGLEETTREIWTRSSPSIRPECFSV